MRNKKESLMNVLKKECTKKVRICTSKFCVTGCLIENYDDEDIVCLENATVTPSSGCGEEKYRESICICDDHIIAFEAIKEQ